jgi:hypothetical protein
MQHFPSITEEEFQMACQKFYDRATRAPDSHGWQHVANDSGVLSIQKEYLVGRPHGSKQEALATAENEEPEEMTDDKDHEVNIANNHFCSLFWSHSDWSYEGDEQDLASSWKGHHPCRVLGSAVSNI